MSYAAAQETCRDYVCAACWADLDYRQPDPENAHIAQVFCQRCQDATPGFISRKFAQWLSERNAQQYQEAKHALRDVVPWLKVNRPQLSEVEMIKQLGF
jgi:hypothetical protein